MSHTKPITKLSILPVPSKVYFEILKQTKVILKLNIGYQTWVKQ